MFDKLLRALGGGPVEDPRPDVPGRKISVPDIDILEAPTDEAPQTVPEEATSALQGRGFVICYDDSSGVSSERRIICHQVYSVDALTYLKARCLERQASRTFRVDRIREVYCSQTGESLGSPKALFLADVSRDHLPLPSPPYRAAQRALKLLVTIARVDGHIHPDELRVTAGFLREALPGPRHRSDRESLEDFAYRAAPSLSDFAATFDLLLRYDRQILPLFFSTLGPLVEADGTQDGQETQLIVELIRLAEQQGIKINLVPY
ncbi:MAG: hypothetical protein DCF29_03775 [Alphaproteobacteria bacterium]|nr:MAG: hypothetical protein DCF29_03775 [Alphaproteobacteria bacterium]